jgi:hypothetical protein
VCECVSESKSYNVNKHPSLRWSASTGTYHWTQLLGRKLFGMRTGGNPFNDGAGIAVTHSTRGAALVGRVGLAQKIVFAFRAARRHERRPFVTVVAAGGRRRRGVGLFAKKHGRYERESSQDVVVA